MAHVERGLVERLATAAAAGEPRVAVASANEMIDVNRSLVDTDTFPHFDPDDTARRWQRSRTSR